MSPPAFKLGLTLAGAVSAGSYTAGVLDYLFETLNLWEKAKAQNQKFGSDHESYDHSVPMHEVQLEIISGASAGGINGTLSLLNLSDAHYKSYNEENPGGENNRFFSSWVDMADTDESDTFLSMLSLSDLKRGHIPNALLNSNSLEIIARKALFIKKSRTYPAWVSKNMDLILTVTNLRGLNFELAFDAKNDDPTVLTQHAGFLWYRRALGDIKPGIPENKNALYFGLDLNNSTHLDHLRSATLSTSAFPIVLKSRELKLAQIYIERFPAYLFGRKYKIAALANKEENYVFNAVDGGLINNEPFGIGLQALSEKAPVAVKEERYALVMIDPFPNRDPEVNPNENQDLISVGKSMFQALRNQVMFNKEGLLAALEPGDHTKFLIAPSRKELQGEEWVKVNNDLASAPLSGFAGFLNRSFREHDYELGRHNCQSFLRYYFSLPQTALKAKLGVLPKTEAIERFGYKPKLPANSVKNFFPIIPDLRVPESLEQTQNNALQGSDEKLVFPLYPKTTMRDLEKQYKKALRKRILRTTNQIVRNPLFSLVNYFYLRGRMYRWVLKLAETELREAGLLKD